MDITPYQITDSSDLNSPLNIAVNAAEKFLNDYFGVPINRGEIETEHALTTSYHDIFQFLYIEVDADTTDDILNVFVDKRTNQVVYCEQSDDLSLDEDIFIGVYMEWLANTKAGDLKGVLDL